MHIRGKFYICYKEIAEHGERQHPQKITRMDQTKCTKLLKHFYIESFFKTHSCKLFCIILCDLI